MASNDTAWISECLEVHNSYRAKHGAPPLKWSEECAEEARKAANYASTTRTLQHTNTQADIFLK